MIQSPSLPKQTRLSAAVTAAFATMAVLFSEPSAAQTTINSPVGPQTWASGTLSITTTGSVINADTSNGSGIEATGPELGTLINDGTVSGYVSALNAGLGSSISAIENGSTGVFKSSMFFGAIWNQGNIGRVSNDGVMNGEIGVSNDKLASIGLIANGANGLITGSFSAVLNDGTIMQIVNAGNIIGANAGIDNYADGTIGTLTNTGVIHGNRVGVDNSGRIEQLQNHADINGQTAVEVNGTITSLVNAGNLRGNDNFSSMGMAISYGGTIGSLINSGTISGTVEGTPNASGVGIYAQNGSIGSLTNNGIITGSTYALNFRDGWEVNGITNSGTIAGDIYTRGGRGPGLRIGGGAGTVYGTLTGLGGAMGQILSDQDVEFTNGNLVLNDHIDVGSAVVTNTAARLQINNAVRITGNFHQASTGTLQIGVSDTATARGNPVDDSGYGRLIVSGSAVLAAGSSVTLQPLGAYAFASGQRFVVVDASLTGTQYNEAALRYAAIGSGLKVTGASVTTTERNYLVLSLHAPTILTSPPPQPSAPPAIPGINNYTGVDDPGLLNLFNATKALEPADHKQAARQLGPLMQVTASRAAAAPTMDALNIISARVNSLREFATSPSTCDSEPLRGMWGQALGGHASQADEGSIDGYSANFGGVLAGLDCAVNERWRVGGVISYSNTEISNTGFTSGSKTRVDGFGLIGYGSYTADRWYANLSGGAVQHRYGTARIMNFPGFTGTARAGFGGTQLVVRAEFGYPLARGPFTVTPIVALTYGYLNQNSYTEDGGDGSALAVGSTHTTSVTTDLAVKFSRRFEAAQGILVPELQIGWRHQYDNAQGLTTSSFAADPIGETAFTTSGPRPTTNSALLTAGISLLRRNDLTLTLRYDLQAAAGFLSQAGSLRVRKMF